MKKILLLTACAGMALSLWAGGIKHPSLLFTPDRVAAAKKQVATDYAYSNAWKILKKGADDALAKNDVMKLQHLALAYQMTGDKKYSGKIKEILEKTAATESWADAEMMQRHPAWRSELQMAHKSMQLAAGYDAIYNDLTPAERKRIAQGLYRLCVEPLLGDWILEPTRIHSFNSMGHNWWTACVGDGAVLALAISNEVPEAAEAAKKAVDLIPAWFEFAGDDIQMKPRTFDRDGGMYESINYASYGITQALLLRQAWLNSHPGEKLPEIPQMSKLPAFFAHVAYPRTGELYNINFGDSHKNITGESSLYLAWAQGVKDPASLWYASHVEQGQFREGYPLHFPLGFLYTPDLKKAPKTPDLPKSHIWNDFGWATMRDSWNKDATMLAVKSGMTWNHAHADANSLILFHKGVDIIKDAGNCTYGKPEYRNYFFQSDAHNVVKFNGEGQPREQQYHGSPLPGKVSNLLDAGNVKYVMANGTGPMSRWFSRNYRHYLWIDNIIYVIDDIKSHEPGKFEWLWHPGGEVKKVGGDLEITNGESAAVIRPLWPEPLAPSNYVHDYPHMLYWETHEAPTENLKEKETYWSLHLPGDTDRIKAVNAIILKDSPKQKEKPKMERRDGKNWIGVRTVNTDGKITDLYINQLADGSLMHINSWIEPDGFETDAYMVALTYDEGTDPMKDSQVTIIYGSSLRHGGNPIHSSQEKQNLVGKIKNGKLTRL